MQFYTFLETSLVTLSLLPHFIAFFSDEEIPGTPGSLASTFLAFGKRPLLIIGFILHRLAFWLFSFLHQIVLNFAFTLSVLGFLIMHISLVAGNTTTIEVSLSLCACIHFIYSCWRVWFILCKQAYEKKTTLKWRYDLGRKKNFEQVSAFFLVYINFLHSLETFTALNLLPQNLCAVITSGCCSPRF